ncbi:MAG: rhodanese-like domain-containing protein [Asgard group archaeon]|nr:rhodanese-like domain-containing protein [Asgard group archaeon]
MMVVHMRRKKTILVSLILTLILTSITNVSAQDYEDISVDEAKNRIDANPEIFILDVRWPSEYDEGHIQNAVNINVYSLESNTDKLPGEYDTEIIVYCQTGSRSILGAEKLVILDYTNISNMEQGFNKWKKSGYPYVIGTNTIPTSDIFPLKYISTISVVCFLLIFLYRKRNQK